jgi:hypothetical protein
MGESSCLGGYDPNQLVKLVPGTLLEDSERQIRNFFPLSGLDLLTSLNLVEY